ncbi:MAG: peptide chain release factor-like protein [Candidatus Omnitrophica bacterium]|nr:peptide chain release factor-like protein [Candidatus Omnitrophota bacterium]
MDEALLRLEDVVEKFIRSQGPGGQKVNKTSTCVYLKHVPTGIEVKCQQERSQAQNRILAWRLLREKVLSLRRRQIAQAVQEKEKIRRQKRKKPQYLKVKILEEKRKHSQKKNLRRKVQEAD